MLDYKCPICHVDLRQWTIVDDGVFYRMECPKCEMGCGSMFSHDMAYEHLLDWYDTEIEIQKTFEPFNET